ncbi:VanZ family protein [Cellulomonas sp. NTE-D12]|uniref:VanZ family protein n=1 Tax=Cellulomonas sp. NTE-D12 TaxID=2962632 RepID=UPI0030812783|nr:hypothetical protein CELD12_11350 [Cellulomonas sp. NTE-D12]
MARPARSHRPTFTSVQQAGTVVVYAVLALYAVFALRLLLFSRPPVSERSVNLVPFATISHYLTDGSSGVRRFALGNVRGNVLLFVLLGAYVSVLTRWTVARAMVVVASASGAVELLQGVFALGASDIDDVMLNGLGGLVGIALVVLLRRVLPDQERLRAVVAALSLLALPVLLVLLFVIRMRL